MAESAIDKRFICAAEVRASQQARAIEYEEIGERLMELRKTAWDKYHALALWNTPPHATFDCMRAVAEDLRVNGDLEATFLAAAIDREVENCIGNAA